MGLIMSETEKNCKLTLYLDTPKMLLRPGVDKHYIRSNGTPTTTWFTGHAFVGLTDENGKEEKWGYYPNPMASLKEEITCTKGHFEREDNAHYNEAIVYMVSREQFDAAKKKVEETARRPGFYQLFRKNCSSVACDILRAGGVEDPPSLFMGLTPHRLTMKKRALQVKRRLEVAFWKAKNTIKSVFTGKKAPTADLFKALKEKPIPVTISQGMEASKSGKPLDVSKILSSLVGKREK